MNRALQYANLLGVVVLAAVCVAQWQAQRRLRLQLNEAEKTTLQQRAKLEEQTKALKSQGEDLEELRKQVSKRSTELRETSEQLIAAESQRLQLGRERDQLQTIVGEWKQAVRLRDERIEEANTRIGEMARRANEAVEKYNGLAKDYNQMVEKLNAAAPAKAGPAKP